MVDFIFGHFCRFADYYHDYRDIHHQRQRRHPGTRRHRTVGRDHCADFVYAVVVIAEMVGSSKHWIICFLSSLLLCATMYGKDTVDVKLHLSIYDRSSGETLPYATILLKNEDQKYNRFSNSEGICEMNLVAQGKYTLSVSYVGYKEYSQDIELVSGNISKRIGLIPVSKQLKEVTVTAVEATGMTSSSTITREAIEHIQPTSFTDVLELLPGGLSKDPKMGVANTITLRENGTKDAAYDISSLGVAFVIDGAPLQTDANLQYLPKAGATDPDYDRQVVNKGVDMRAISTDDIEKIEVIRGIPSVVYGDLTGGVVKITRKMRPTRWEARIKVDEYSKLMSLGKGFTLVPGKTVLNFNVDYLDSKADPRDNFEKYNRLTGSVRLQQKWASSSTDINLQSALDYTGSFDDVKTDPDISLIKIDFYKSSYNKTRFSNTISFKSTKKNVWKNTDINTSISLENNLLERKKFISIVRDTPIPNNLEEGEHDGLFLPYQYVAYFRSEGKPFYAFVKWLNKFEINIWKIKNDITVGADWNLAKNFGRGQVYDINRPISPLWDTRPRAFSEIPADQKLAFFLESNITLPLGSHKLFLSRGIRTLNMPGLNKKFAMSGKTYWEPRVNIKWQSPKWMVADNPMVVEFGGGWGRTSKTPTMDHLYPNKYYNDLVQLNYYHENFDFRRLHIRTYIIDKTNYDIQPARNEKWELRGDISYAGNRLSVTYFKENLNSGFRTVNYYQPYYFKKYDVKSIDHASVTERPQLHDFTYEDKTILEGYGRTENGSALYKEGVEYQFTSARVKPIRTKFTVNGAWFKTTYTNSIPLFQTVPQVIDGEAIKYNYIGLYDYNSGHTSQRFNTNVIMDTQVPKLGLIFSTTVQSLWYTMKQTFPTANRPTAYMDVSGQLKPYDEEAEKDIILQHLIRESREGYSEKIPVGINVNFKATKEFKDFLKVALFVNRILDYHPDYESYGILVRRHVDSYFGMELNFKI